MARIRSAKPDWWTKSKWCALPRDIRFTYKGIWEVMCDDDGRFLADARLVKSQVWPLDDDITVKKIELWLERISAVTCTTRRGDRLPAVVLYTVDGVRYGWLPSFNDHQKISHPTESKLPAIPAAIMEALTNRSVGFANGSGKSPGNSPTSGAERDFDLDGEKDLESGAEESDPSPARIEPEDRAAPPAPRVVLPEDAKRFVEQLYGLATEKRRLDVTAQLYDTLDPEGRGARLRKGVRVKARSAEHLAECCRAVIEDPPRAIDAAIVIVLEKLQDPPPGPSQAEKAADRERAAIELEERYYAAAKQASVRWAREHAEEFRKIEAEVNRHITHGGMVGDKARETLLTQRCARAAGFPDFASWSAQ